MSNVNDEKILKLQQIVDEKRKAIAEQKRFAPITNCNITLNGQRYNIHAMTKEDLTILLLQVYSLHSAAAQLSLEKVMVSGYTLEDWLADLNTKLGNLNIKEKESELKSLEKRLQTLLSEDKRTELELNSIAGILND